MPARFRILFIIVLIALLVACGQMLPMGDDEATATSASLSTGVSSTTTHYASLKIVPPPDGGMYLGQHEWRQWESPDDIETFEAAVGRKVALFSEFPMAYNDNGFSFIPEIAEEAWQKGRVVQAHGLGDSPMEAAENKINGFTVDNLLKGEYDDKIHQLALQFKQFGKPMFFFTTREPNGIGQEWFGGFGVNGDKDLQWALDNQKGLAEFDPSGTK